MKTGSVSVDPTISIVGPLGGCSSQTRYAFFCDGENGGGGKVQREGYDFKKKNNNRKPHRVISHDYLYLRGPAGRIYLHE